MIIFFMHVIYMYIVSIWYVSAFHNRTHKFTQFCFKLGRILFGVLQHNRT